MVLPRASFVLFDYAQRHALVESYIYKMIQIPSSKQSATTYRACGEMFTQDSLTNFYYKWGAYEESHDPRVLATSTSSQQNYSEWNQKKASNSSADFDQLFVGGPPLLSIQPLSNQYYCLVSRPLRSLPRGLPHI